MIRMTPTHTITHLPKAPLVTKRRTIILLASLIITPFLLAFLIGATVGIAKGVTGDTNRGPSAHTLDLLRKTSASSKTPCWAEWNEIQATMAAGGMKGDDGAPLDGFEVICGANQVTQYNDGFAESKHDDCEQGFKAACTWIATTKN